MVHGHSTTIPVYTKEIHAILFLLIIWLLISTSTSELRPVLAVDEEEAPPPGDASPLLTEPPAPSSFAAVLSFARCH